MDNISRAIVEIKSEIDKFLDNKKLRCLWLNDSQGIIELYIRNSIRRTEGQDTMVKCVDIGNIIISKPRNGIFKAILAYIEGKGHNVYVESILNRKIVPFLERQGYKIIANDPGAIDICAIKLTK